MDYKVLLKETLEDLDTGLIDQPALKYKVQVALDYLFYLEDKEARA